jgi:tetratricopeptide (TPR) repeat protein
MPNAERRAWGKVPKARRAVLGSCGGRLFSGGQPRTLQFMCVTMGRERQQRRLLLARRSGGRKQCIPREAAAMALAVSVAVGLGACLGPAPIDQARLLADRGRTTEAIQTLEQHLAGHPADVEEQKLLIRLYGSAGRADRAAQQADQLAELLPPQDPLPWVELGAALELAHRYDEALSAYDRAASEAPANALGAKRGGMRAARWGELELAAPRLREAVRRDASDAETWHALGVVLVGLGELDAARRAYASGLAVDATALENRLGLATVALRQDHPGEALAQYEALLAARPKFTDALLGKSWCLILMGDYGSAEAVLRKAEELGADRQTIARQRGALPASPSGRGSP